VSDIEARAANANALKENPLLQEILSGIERAAVDAWVGTPAQDGQQAREFAWMLYKAAGRFRVEIQSAIDEQRISVSRLTAPLR
jgi:hypothetical protein